MTRVCVLGRALVGIGACRDRSAGQTPSKAGSASEPSNAPSGPRAIPTVTAPIKVDGEWDEPDWSKRALRGQFLGDDAKLSRPSSEVRWLHDTTTLYVGLYAADDNIQSTDAFVVKIGDRQWTVYANGKLEPTSDGAHVAVDKDGTIDDPSNHDEEWVVELALPLASLGLSAHKPTHVSASRCDTPLDQPQRCAAWSGDVKLD